MIFRRRKPEPGDHLASIIVQNHPYLGWINGDIEVGGEAAALGLVDCQRWEDSDVSVNVNGSVARLQHFPNCGPAGIADKPRTFTGVMP